MTTPFDTVTEIRQEIVMRGFYYASTPTLDRLIVFGDSDPGGRLRMLQSFAANNGWRVVTRDDCGVALFVAN